MCMLHAATHAWLSCFPCNLITKPFPWIQHACHALNVSCMEIGPACLPCFEFVWHCIGHIWSTCALLEEPSTKLHACVFLFLSLSSACHTFLWTCVVHLALNSCPAFVHQPKGQPKGYKPSGSPQTKWSTSHMSSQVPPHVVNAYKAIEASGQEPMAKLQSAIRLFSQHGLAWEAKITLGQVLCHPDNRGGTMLNAWDVHRKRHLMMSVGINPSVLHGQSMAFTLASEPTTKQKRFEKNYQLVDAPCQGTERYLSVASSHFVAWRRAVQASCKSSGGEVLSMDALLAGKPADDPFRKLCQEGWECQLGIPIPKALLHGFRWPWTAPIAVCNRPLKWNVLPRWPSWSPWGTASPKLKTLRTFPSQSVLIDECHGQIPANVWWWRPRWLSFDPICFQFCQKLWPKCVGRWGHVHPNHLLGFPPRRPIVPSAQNCSSSHISHRHQSEWWN